MLALGVGYVHLVRVYGASVGCGSVDCKLLFG